MAAPTQHSTAAAVLGPEKFRRLYPAQFVRACLASGTRPDGRRPDEPRKVSLNTGARAPDWRIKGSITTADGSATVRLGSTYVTCGIKAEVAIPPVSEPKHGYFVPNLDLPAMCSPRFPRGAPGQLTQALSWRLYEMCTRCGMLPLETLCLEEGKACWVLYADIVCLNYAGNVFDAAVLALVSALRNLRLPVAKYDDEAGIVTATPTKDQKVDLVRVPISVSCAVLDDTFLLDPTDEEEDVSGAAVTVVIDEKGTFCGVYKAGRQPLTQQQMQAAFRIAKERSAALRKMLPGETSTG
ncbi:ribosomal protein S5 domain 2-type protein [Hyaloraphidium curvatum]|nr:ribosomal protein S5 domain 2-type protein [Hyaloraphidium curvatum]